MEENISKAKIAGLSYTIGNIILKCIVFFSLPIFTKLISPTDFGIYNNYIAYETIISAVLGLGFYSTIKKAFFEFKRDFNSFYSSITLFMLLNFIVLFILVLSFNTQLTKLTGFDTEILIILMCQSFGSALLLIYASFLNVTFKYKEYLIISFINSITNILISIFLVIFCFPNASYFGRIIGTAIPYFLVASYIIFIVFYNGGFKLKKNYIKFALFMGCPLVPHVIAQFILNQSDRLLISKYIDDYSSGLYSYAYNICTILLVVLQSMDSSWTSWSYYKYEIHDNNIVKEKSKDYMLFSFNVFIGFVCLAPEVFKLMADESYWAGIDMILPLALSMFFLFLYFIPVNLEYYKKKTIFVSLGTIGAALINIVLNVLLIPKYSFSVAAYTTLISYFLLFMIHFIISLKYEIRDKYDVKVMLLVFIFSIIIFLGLTLISKYKYIYIVIRYFILLCDCLFIIIYFKKYYINILKKRRN